MSGRIIKSVTFIFLIGREEIYLNLKKNFFILMIVPDCQWGFAKETTEGL